MQMKCQKKIIGAPIHKMTNGLPVCFKPPLDPHVLWISDCDISIDVIHSAFITKLHAVTPSIG